MQETDRQHRDEEGRCETGAAPSAGIVSRAGIRPTELGQAAEDKLVT